MEESTCNECGAPIGGSNHNLHATNTHATGLLRHAGHDVGDGDTAGGYEHQP